MRNNLRAIRDAKGWTLKELAEKTAGEYAFQTIGAYEKSERPLSPEFLEVMARVLEVSQEEIQSPQEFKDETVSYNAEVKPLPGVKWEGWSRENLERVLVEVTEEYDKLKDSESPRARLLLDNIIEVAEEIKHRRNHNLP